MRPGDHDSPRQESIEWEVLLGRVLELPEGEQLRLHRALSEALGDRIGHETPTASQARLRGEALATMRAAAEHLRLPPGQAPTVTQFKKAAREASLAMSFRAVYAAFENNWELASRFYRGQEIPPTPARRALVRSLRKRNATTNEAAIICLRRFLNQDPPLQSATRADYEEWAREVNDAARPGVKPVYAQAGQIHMILRVSWSDCLAVARNEKSLEETQKQYLAELLDEAGPLVGFVLAAWYLAISPHGHGGRVPPGFPQPVVRFGKHNWVWRFTDIKAYKRGKRNFTRERGELQEDYVTSRDLAGLLGVHRDTIRSRLHRHLKEPDILPPPAGRAGRHLYWERAQVNRWMETHTLSEHKIQRGRRRRSRVKDESAA